MDKTTTPFLSTFIRKGYTQLLTGCRLKGGIETRHFFERVD